MASAQAPTSYRVHELGLLPGTSTGYSKAYGLNQDGDVVGISTSSSGAVHAFVWSLNGNFGLTAMTMTDLHTGASLDSQWQSLARDININGQIAGHILTSLTLSPESDPISPTSFGGTRRAHRWSVTSGPTITAENLGILGGTGTTESSEAHRINDENPAWIVGWSEVIAPECPPESEDPLCDLFVRCGDLEFLGFRRQASNGQPLEPLVPPPAVPSTGPDNGNSWGFAVNVSRVLAGQTHICQASQGAGCSGRQDAARWSSPASGAELTPLPVNTQFQDGELGTHTTFGINDAGNMVGLGHALPVIPGGPDCGKRAAFWDNATANPFNLGSVSPLPAGDETAARAINNADGSSTLIVTGTNLTQTLAYRWIRSNGTWSTENLNGRIGPCSPGFVLVDALDVNDDGWIVGWGIRGSGLQQQTRAYLLVPIAEGCWADLNGDCHIDGLDVGVLLAGWSEPSTAPGCGGASPCFADLNCDGKVDGLDIGILLEDWTGSSATCNAACESAGGSSQMMSGGGGSSLMSAASAEAGDSGPTLQELVDALEAAGMSDLAALLEEIWSTIPQ